MKYLVIKSFTDLQDNNYKYGVGDEYPRSGLEVSDERIEELSTNKNRRKAPLIEKIADVIKEEKVTDVIENKEEQPEPASEEKPKRKRKTKDVE